jgi:hypothetical protein
MPRAKLPFSSPFLPTPLSAYDRHQISSQIIIINNNNNNNNHNNNNNNNNNNNKQRTVATPHTAPDASRSSSEAAKPGNTSTPSASACAPIQRHTSPRLTTANVDDFGWLFVWLVGCLFGCLFG